MFIENNPFNFFSSSQIPTSIEAKTVKSYPKEENLRLRQNLALSYRLLDDLSLNEVSLYLI